MLMLLRSRAHVSQPSSVVRQSARTSTTVPAFGQLMSFACRSVLCHVGRLTAHQVFTFRRLLFFFFTEAERHRPFRVVPYVTGQVVR